MYLNQSEENKKKEKIESEYIKKIRKIKHRRQRKRKKKKDTLIEMSTDIEKAIEMLRRNLHVSVHCT